jgi:hypothetical protein
MAVRKVMYVREDDDKPLIGELIEHEGNFGSYQNGLKGQPQALDAQRE